MPYDQSLGVSGFAMSGATPVSFSFDPALFQPLMLTPDTVAALTGEGTVTMVASGATLALSGTSAAANGRFDIVIRYSGDPTYQAAFTQAAARWTQIITARHSGREHQPVRLHRRSADRREHRVDRRCGRDPRAGRPRLGAQRIAAARARRHGVRLRGRRAACSANGTWTDVILHEMGHILGIGTLWSSLGLKNSAGDYIGARAPCRIPGAERQCRGHVGSGRARAAVPARPAPTGPRRLQRRADDRLRESAGVAMPISRMTIGALQDLGYTVNYSAADATRSRRPADQHHHRATAETTR